jgi:hypothetical protein
MYDTIFSHPMGRPCGRVNYNSNRSHGSLRSIDLACLWTINLKEMIFFWRQWFGTGKLNAVPKCELTSL